jgi:hypothetical protein
LAVTPRSEALPGSSGSSFFHWVSVMSLRGIVSVRFV